MYMPTTQNLSQPDIDALADLWKKGQRMALIQSFTDCQTPDRVGSEGCNMERRMGQMVLTAKAFKAAGCKHPAGPSVALSRALDILVCSLSTLGSMCPSLLTFWL